VKTIAVANTTREGKDQWIQAISQAQAKLVERIPKSAAPSKPIAPEEWMKDGATSCGLCSQPFGLVNRRVRSQDLGYGVISDLVEPASLPSLWHCRLPSLLP